MEFPKEFFLDEVREGFYVPAMMKRAWAAEIEILFEIDKICENHGLHYCIDYGTLLGAIRHRGFIPWDDDIDIMMMREDYEIFSKVANAELPEELSFCSIMDKSNYELTSHVKHNKMLISSKALGKYHNYLYGAGVDIFPYDRLSTDPKKEKNRMELFDALCILASLPSTDEKYITVFEYETKKVEKLLGIKLQYSPNYRKELLQLLKNCVQKFNQDGGHKIASLPDLTLYKDMGKGVFEDSWFGADSFMNFEFLSLPAPKEYFAVIKNKYHDYGLMKKDGGAHNYPLYKKIEAEYMKGIGGKLFYQYSIDRNELKARNSTAFFSNKKGNATEQEKSVLFLPSLYSHWDTMRGVFEEARKDKKMECFVMPIPYYFKDGLGNCSPVQWDFELYENELGKNSPYLLDFRNFDLEALHPDAVFINEPYDEYNLSFMVEPSFFSKKLKHYTKQLFYIPWFVTSEIDIENPEDGKAIVNAENYIVMPALVHADYAILQSEMIVKLYRGILEKESGKEYAKYWEEKLLPLGNPLSDERPIEENSVAKIIWSHLRKMIME
ncbi:LicD family protein [Oribacterium parvum]|uniref:LicD family protein n=1 Tax=Oribacterium parvum TaxID=1501329 RepID=UPI0028DB587D|nr:LicD family protein [Oribacterium parvum]